MVYKIKKALATNGLDKSNHAKALRLLFVKFQNNYCRNKKQTVGNGFTGSTSVTKFG